MTKLTRLKAMLAVPLVPLALAVAACSEPGPAESAGEKIGRAATDMGRSIDRATDEAKRKANQAASATGEFLDDAAITTRVKAAMLAEPALGALAIDVDTHSGVVSLSGTVDSQRDRQRAAEIAAAVPSVKGVENRLVVKTAG